MSLSRAQHSDSRSGEAGTKESHTRNHELLLLQCAGKEGCLI